jgi:ferredoxin-thioredoxin reductase catalytic subunit
MWKRPGKDKLSRSLEAKHATYAPKGLPGIQLTTVAMIFCPCQSTIDEAIKGQNKTYCALLYQQSSLAQYMPKGK